MGNQKSIRQFVQDMPKSEIHIHLEGAILPETVLELADRNDLVHLLPSDDIDKLREWYSFSNFTHFIEVYLAIQAMLCRGEDFALVTYQNGADMAAQNIRYREITFTPFTHTQYMDKGLKIEEILEGLEAGRRQAKEEFGVEIRWVFDIPRNLSFPKRDGREYDPEPARLTLEYAIKGKDQGVVAYGLGGYEVNAPPEPFAHAFVEAKERGLLSVPHAGETEGPASVWGSVNDLKADRIGHGVRAWDDPDLVNYLKENQIPLEINPTSNICLHVYEEYEGHPFRKLDESGVIVTVNSDDPPLFNTTLSQEYLVLAQDFGYDQQELARIGRNAFVHAGVEADIKRTLLEEFDGWVEENIA